MYRHHDRVLKHQWAAWQNRTPKMSKKRWCVFWGRNCRRVEWRAWKLQYLNKASAWMDLMGFYAVTFFVHLKNNSQMPNKLMTTKKQSELGLLRQMAIKRINTILIENHSFKKLHRKAADDEKYSPAESTNTIQEVPSKNCNWEFMNWAYMLM